MKVFSPFQVSGKTISPPQNNPLWLTKYQAAGSVEQGLYTRYKVMRSHISICVKMKSDGAFIQSINRGC